VNKDKAGGRGGGCGVGGQVQNKGSSGLAAAVTSLGSTCPLFLSKHYITERVCVYCMYNMSSGNYSRKTTPT